MNSFGGAVKDTAEYAFALIGVPFDRKSSFRRGPAQGPDAVRKASSGDAINPCTELGPNLELDTVLADLGNIDCEGDFSIVFKRLEDAVTEVLAKEAVPVVIGGDHSLTYPIVRAMAGSFHPLDILHFDAHPDLYEEYQGDRYSHACPFARIMEDGLADRLVQVGIRAATPAQRERAAGYGVRMIEMKDFREDLSLEFEHPVFISFDIDALDPAFAPGVSHCEPGGLSTRQALSMIHRLKGEIIGMDLVEVNPELDPTGITAAAGAKIIMEVLGKIISGRVG